MLAKKQFLAMPTCSLCLRDRELRNSHIIPEFMYANLYDKEPKRFYRIEVSDREAKSRIEQKGQREYLFCGECEAKLSKYEKYADENLYGKNQNAEAILTKGSQTESKRQFLYEFSGFDYGKMKLFLDSLLFRMLISKSFKTPDYGSDVLETLRNSLFTEDPLQPEQFPCVVQAIMTGTGKLLMGSILGPLVKDYGDKQVLSIFIDGLDFNFYIEGVPPERDFKPYLQLNGDLKIIGRLIHDLPGLMDMLKELMGHLRDRLGH